MMPHRAGAPAGSDAALRRAGSLRVFELEELCEAAEMLARMPRLAGERLMIPTNDGRAGVLAADRLANLDGHLAPLPPRRSGPKGNPVDILGDADDQPL